MRVRIGPLSDRFPPRYNPLMTRRAPALDLPIQLDRKAPLHEALYRALRDAMLSGRLAPGNRMPASRDLAAQLEIARGTVVTCYAQLASEGYLQAHAGSGTFVAEQLPDQFFAAHSGVGKSLPAGRRSQRRSGMVQSGSNASELQEPRRTADRKLSEWAERMRTPFTLVGRDRPNLDPPELARPPGRPAAPLARRGWVRCAPASSRSPCVRRR